MHPKNKHHRIKIGIKKGIKRAKGLSANDPNASWVDKTSKLLRNTTKLCSCSMCGNPRHNKWSKAITIQEIKNQDKVNNDLNDLIA